MQGPNVKKLIASRMAVIAIPRNGGFQDGIAFLTNPAAITQAARDATEWVNDAVSAVKQSPNNPFGDDDEAIAGEVLRQIEEKRRPWLKKPQP